MVSKNNKILHLRKSATKVSKYKIKKLSVGVASVLVGATFFLGSTTSASASDEQLADKQAGVTQQTDQNATNTNDRVLKFDNATSTATTDNADSSAAKMSNVAQADNSANNATVANNLDKKSITDSTLSNNNDLKSTEMQSTVADQAAADDANTADQTATEKQATVTNQATVDNTVNTADQATQAAAEKTTTPASTAANTQAAAPVVTLRAAATADTSTTTTVNNWTGLINALNNPYYQTITVDGTINAMGTGTVEGNDRTVVIKGADQNASIDFGSTPLNVNGTMQLAFENLILKTASANGAVTFNNSSNTSTVTFKDVTHSGASLYGGSGNAAVVIDGTTTSTVSTSSKPTAKTYSANGNGANIWGAKSVTVADGANFTLNRSAIGDGINLPDGATVQVGDNATMTVNLNTDNGTESARYHDAGIFMLNGGNFLTGRNAVVNMNTSIGQAVSIGADRPGIGVTAADRFGGYGTSQSRNAGPTAVTFGDYSQFNFTGRDGFILGNNANFTSGEYSNVHFQNQGRGVALDLANNSNIVISKHSNTLFESNGKTGTSGSYDGYNYIGVNEGGNITVDEYATFRVILTGRGDNPWDDVISLDSRNSSTNAAFTSKKGAIVDIRDDNTNFYAELISFPLGAANSVIDIQDPLYLNLQRYSADGATKGWMPVGGTDINSTSAAYTANLIYMGGTKGVLKIGGTNYVVYQQIKSDGAQQIWLNVDAVEFNKNGFAAKDEYNNGANPDVSISGKELTANILANDIKDNQTSPTAKGAKGTAPYYGISTMRASHQIWFPHGTEIQAAGQHQNTIKYVYEDGTEAAPTVTQSVDMTRDITLDLTADQIATVEAYAATHTADETLNYIKNLYVVSQDSGWQVAEGINTKTAYDAVATPEIAGYTASIKSTNANGVTVGDDAATVHAILDIPAGTVVSNGKLSETYLNNGGTVVMPANYETVVVYQKEIQNQPVTIIYQDKSENNKVLATDELEGKPGTALDYSTADKIQSFIDKGYKLVSDGVPNNATFGDEPETYYVTLEHDIAPVGPNNPHEPGTPVNPNDPDGPKWPTQDQYTKDYTSTVEFVDDQGNKMPGLDDDDVQTSTWTRTLNVDKVTGDVLNPAEPWTPDKPTYDKVNVPVVPGYYADQPEVPAKPTVQENITDKVVYKPMGKIVPVDPSGNPIPDAPTPQYPNDPTDPTKTTPDQPVPEIPGMTPEVPSVTPENPGKDTPVVYNPVVEKHSLTERFVDEAGNELAPSEVIGTDYVKNDKYNVTGDAKVIDGYYLTAMPSNAEGTFGDDNVTVTFTYAKLGKIIPVDPSGNPIPDAPTPQYPNDPTDPTKTTPNQPVPSIPGMNPEVPAITPNQPGEDTPVVYVPVVEGKYSLIERFVDEAGQEISSTIVKGTEYVKNDKYNVTGDAKVIDGYYLTAVPSNVEGTFDDEDVTVTFTYAKLGKIIPVDPSGNPIPDAPTPQYPNDPTDPTKTTPNQPVPSIPGMNPEVPAVTPNQPGQDTPVTYVPVVPEKQLQTAKIVYVDTKTGKTLETDTVTGKSGEKIDYSTTPRIDEWRDKGYRLVEDGFAEAGTPVYDDNDDVEQIFIVKLDHDTAPVGPNDPHEPGTPINPNDPNGPKWPAKDSYTKQYTSTVHFVDENGNKLHDDNVQTSTWTRTLIVDKATGEILNPDEAWHSDIDKYSDVKVDPIKGYYTDRKSVPGEVAQQQDIVNTVVYKQIGKIVPVDPSGNPIPDAPTPQYPNDPTDPTKTTPNQPVPEIPGMIPEVPSVTPENPGEDTPIVYNKVETPTPKTVDVTPETPKTVDVTSETPKATPVKTAPQVEKVKAPELPQTGEKQNNALTAVGASIMTGLLGILAFAKKKKDDKEI
ncbi:mucin-binding protein [Leuconostoc lactis]|uniref:mucin-binding protein n=1 Tax=Leuconostoc lactis TaxID=1246 RepID=UPI003315CC98